MKKNYQCTLCKNIYDSQKSVKMHVFRTHKIRPAIETEHYKPTSKKITTPKNKKYDWRKWVKYPDGSRKYKEVSGQLIKQEPGQYFAESDLKKINKKKQAKPALPEIIGFSDSPKIHSDGIVINVMVKIPLSFGLPVIMSPEE